MCLRLRPRSGKRSRGALRILAAGSSIAAACGRGYRPDGNRRRGRRRRAGTGIRRRVSLRYSNGAAGVYRAGRHHADFGGVRKRHVVDRMERSCPGLQRRGFALFAHAGQWPQRFGGIRRRGENDRCRVAGQNDKRFGRHRHVGAKFIRRIRQREQAVLPARPARRQNVCPPILHNVQADRVRAGHVLRNRDLRHICCLIAIGNNFAISNRRLRNLARVAGMAYSADCPAKHRGSWPD